MLVVEDDADMRAALRDALSGEGYAVVEAEHGLRALEIARGTPPDVILMDLALPVMDGWEATRVLKRDPRTRAIPVIAVTGRTPKASEADARSAGCDAYLAKPYAIEAMLEALARVAG